MKGVSVSSKTEFIDLSETAMPIDCIPGTRRWRLARGYLVALVLGVLVAVPYVLTLFVLHEVLGARLEGMSTFLLSVLFLALFLRPLYGTAQSVVDRAFYGERYEALRALERFSRGRILLCVEELKCFCIQVFLRHAREKQCRQQKSEDQCFHNCVYRNAIASCGCISLVPFHYRQFP
mgnify:CR=1 FL=1